MAPAAVTSAFYIEVTPASVTLAPGARQQFTALGRDQSGRSWSVRMDWKATGGSIATDGMYTAPATAGSHRVIGTRSGDSQTDTSIVTVSSGAGTPPAGKSFWIEVTPASATLAPGGSQQLTARGRDRNGASYSVNVSWRATGGSISTNGLYTAPTTTGSYLVIATRVGDVLADTTAITVSGGTTPPATGLAGECSRARPEWIWCDDFESDRLSLYFEYDDAKGRFVRQAGAGNGGSTAMKAVYTTAPQQSAGSLHLAFGRTPQPYFRPVDAGTANYREVYWRVFVRYPSNWQGGGAEKLSRATSFVSSSTWAQAMIAHVWSGGDAPYSDYLYIDPASGTDASGNIRTTTYNDFNNLRWLGAVKGATPLFSAALRTSWHCVEAHAKLNTAGQSNGVFELWVDGKLDAAKTGLNWVGSYSAYGINAVFVENFWNRGAPVQEERYLDNFVVSTARIGCG